MCGPSNSEKDLAGSESNLAQSLQQNYATNFSEQQGVLTALNNSLSPTLEAGPNQQGFSSAELAADNSKAIDTTSQNYQSAARALNTQTAGRNDSGNLPESGVDQGLKENLASSAAGQLSNEQLGITEANYGTGRSNYNSAVQGEMGLAGLYAPNATASQASGANQNAFGEANTISTEENQEQSEIASGVTSLAMGAATFGAGAMGGGGFEGGLDALTGQT
jgi:hypothetical protein